VVPPGGSHQSGCRSTRGAAGVGKAHPTPSASSPTEHSPALSASRTMSRLGREDLAQLGMKSECLSIARAGRPLGSCHRAVHSREGTRSLHHFATSHGYFAHIHRPRGPRVSSLIPAVRPPGATTGYAHPRGSSAHLSWQRSNRPPEWPVGRSPHGKTRRTARTLCSGGRPLHSGDFACIQAQGCKKLQAPLRA